jgi:HPr kinase/phosphorylase
MFTVSDLYRRHQKRLILELVSGQEGMNRSIPSPEAERPGLSLTGYLKGYNDKRILVFGQVEMAYLRDLDKCLRRERLEKILSKKVPAVIVTQGYQVMRELKSVCQALQIPLFSTTMPTTPFLSKLILLLNEEFSPSMSCHGTLVEVFGVGVLIQGDSSVGKSEAALGLIERGHRLISDDVVKVKRRESGHLEGFGAELTRHHMEIRGIGIINVAHLYGAVCVRDHKSIDLVVKLETWDDKKYYDRVGIDEKFCQILAVKLPHHILPVKPGRDVVLLLETIALNHRLRVMGYNSAKDFNVRLLEVIKSKQKNLGKNREVYA